MIMNNKWQRVVKETHRIYEYFRYCPSISRR